MTLLAQNSIGNKTGTTATDYIKEETKTTEEGTEETIVTVTSDKVSSSVDIGSTVKVKTTEQDYSEMTSDGFDVYTGGTLDAHFGEETTIGETSEGKGNVHIYTDDDAVPHVDIRSGEKEYGCFTMDGLKIYNGNDAEIAHLGYGEGAASSGKAKAPYYTFGNRKTGTSVGNYSVAEGNDATASNYCAHAEGNTTTASGNSSHAEGLATFATGMYSHAEGDGTSAAGMSSHAEGVSCSAKSNYCHAEGNHTTASGNIGSHAEGYYTTASGPGAHAEGSNTTASGSNSHTEGDTTTTEGTNSRGNAAHAEGYGSEASGNYSHAQNHHTVAASASQTAMGKYNVKDSSGQYALIVGNGSSDTERSNAMAMDWKGMFAALTYDSTDADAENNTGVTLTRTSGGALSNYKVCRVQNMVTITFTVKQSSSTSTSNNCFVGKVDGFLPYMYAHGATYYSSSGIIMGLHSDGTLTCRVVGSSLSSSASWTGSITYIGMPSEDS